MITYKLKINCQEPRVLVSDMEFVAGDVNAYRLEFTFYDNGEKLSLSDKILTVKGRRADGAILSGSGQIDGTQAVFVPANAFYAVPGELVLEIALTDSAGNYTTTKILSAAVLESLGEPTEMATTNVSAYVTLLHQLTNRLDSADRLIAETKSFYESELAEVSDFMKNKPAIENGEGVGSLVGVVPESAIQDETDFANTATADNAVTFGKSNVNSGKRSVMAGKLNTNSGANSIVTGLNNNNASTHSIIGGGNNTVSKNAMGGLVVGEYHTVNDKYNIVGGTTNTANATVGFVTGGYNTVNAAGSITGGTNNQNNSDYSIVGGRFNRGRTDTLLELGNGAQGAKSNAFEVYMDGSISLDNGETKLTPKTVKNLVSAPNFGVGNTNADNLSIMAGQSNTNKGNNNIVTGIKNTSTGGNSIVTGRENNNASTHSIVGGGHNTVSNEALCSLVSGDYNKANAALGIVSGANNTVNSPMSLVVGGWNTTNAERSITCGVGNKNNGAYSIVGGQYNVGKSNTLLELGNGTDGANRSNAFEVYTDGSISLDNGENKLTPTGMKRLVDVQNQFANALKGNASGEVIRIDDVSPIEHNMSVNVRSEDVDVSTTALKICGKNLIPAKIETHTSRGVTFECLGDGTVHVYGTNNGEDNSYYNILMISTANGTFTLSGCPSGGAHGANGTYYIEAYRRESKRSAFDTGEGVVFDADHEPLTIQLGVKPGVTVDFIFKPMLEVGTGDKVFEAGIEPITYPVSADGTVEGITNVYSNMTLMSDTAGVMIDCEYNKDINKAFLKLQNAIISLGGNV